MKVCISVITYNEQGNIRAALKDLAEHNFGYDVVVVDNGSNDDTVAICREMGVEVVSHCTNTGGSPGTLMSYFKYAHYYGYDVMVQFDGDHQHKASELPLIIDPIREGRSDFVIGSRFIEKKGFQSYFFRRLGIQLFSAVHTRAMGRLITDATSGFRAYGPRTIDFFGNRYTGEVYDNINQFLLLAHYAGLDIMEVPVLMQARMHGLSEYDFWNSVFFPLKGFATVLGCWLQKEEIQKKGRMLS